MIIDTFMFHGHTINITDDHKNINGKPVVYYRARITTFYDPETHKQKQKTISGRTIQEIKDKIIHELDPSMSYANYHSLDTTVEEALEEYVKVHFSGGKTTTYETDMCRIKLINKGIGDVKIQELTHAQIQHQVDEISKDHSPATVHAAVSLLRCCLQQYCVRNLIISNPCEGLRLPVIQHDVAIVLSDEEMRRWFKVLKDYPLYYLFFRILYLLGLRVGELRGLSWDKIDFVKRTVRIEQHMEDGKNNLQPYVKNNNNVTLPCSDEVMDCLNQLLELQLYQKEVKGDEWDNPDNLTFTLENGQPVTNYYLTKYFQSTLEMAGCPKARIHDLRHTFASNPWEMENDLELVRIALRHKDSFNTRVYIHPTIKTQEKCRSLMDCVAAKLSENS